MGADTLGQLRQLMYQPSAVWLVTECGGERWLTDQYVLYCITGHEVLGSGDFPDGPYKLGVSKGLEPRDSVPPPDIDVYFEAVYGQASWLEARPSEWSVAEHPGKAMLWESSGIPCLIGESTWAALRRYHPQTRVSYSGELNIFRFELGECLPSFECCDGEVEHCATRQEIVAYAAGIQVPEGQEGVAQSIVRCLTQLEPRTTIESESGGNSSGGAK